MSELTRRQQEIYERLRELQDSGAPAPKLDELCDLLGLKSRGSLHKHVQSLVQAGLVRPLQGKHRGVRLTRSSPPGVIKLPLLGFIAAGSPIEAVAGHEECEVPASLVGRGRCYVLQVKGDSMLEEGIFDGDWIIVEHRDTALDGDIVVALVDGEFATLKRLRLEADTVILVPANTGMAALRYRPERIQIQGVLVAQMRRYDRTATRLTT